MLGNIVEPLEHGHEDGPSGEEAESHAADVYNLHQVTGASDSCYSFGVLNSTAESDAPCPWIMTSEAQRTRDTLEWFIAETLAQPRVGGTQVGMSPHSLICRRFWYPYREDYIIGRSLAALRSRYSD